LYACTREIPCEDTGKSQQSISQEKNPHQKSKSNVLVIAFSVTGVELIAWDYRCMSPHPVHLLR
jgi:hypothetical protein